MILLCDCYNSTADALYGKGKRPHSKLTTIPSQPRQQEYLCDLCYWVRTLAEGRRTGEKVKHRTRK